MASHSVETREDALSRADQLTRHMPGVTGLGVDDEHEIIYVYTTTRSANRVRSAVPTEIGPFHIVVGSSGRFHPASE